MLYSYEFRQIAKISVRSVTSVIFGREGTHIYCDGIDGCVRSVTTEDCAHRGTYSRQY